MMDPTARANRDFYAKVAREYDASESCLVDRQLVRYADTFVDRVLGLLDRPSPRVLDACGGSGNLSLRLLKRGVTPVTVDVSAEMLAIYRQKALALGAEPETVVSEIATFLANESAEWDLILFSSALHHLEDPSVTLELALSRLAHNGVIGTIFDPIRVGPVGRRLRTLDYRAHVLLNSPGYVAGRLFRNTRGAATTSGALAERWADEGLDDEDLVDVCRRSGCEVVLHDRHCAGRFRVTRILLRILRRPSSFSLIAVRRGPAVA